MGIFKGGRRKELQQEIDRFDNQISNMKKGFSSIVREYHFESVQAFYKERKVMKIISNDVSKKMIKLLLWVVDKLKAILDEEFMKYEIEVKE